MSGTDLAYAPTSVKAVWSQVWRLCAYAYLHSCARTDVQYGRTHAGVRLYGRARMVSGTGDAVWCARAVLRCVACIVLRCGISEYQEQMAAAAQCGFSPAQ
eukprot:2861312-Rhodomonas_salina.1